MPIVSTGAITIVDVNDGLDASLSANSYLLSADASGTVASFAGAETTMTIREGGVNTSSLWSFHISATGGGISYRDSDDTSDRTGTGTTNGALTGTVGFVRVVALSQDLSYLDITATKSGQSITRRFSVAKARAGTNGTNGTNGTRGTITTARAIAGTSWSDAEAATAISDAGGGSPLQGDVVTLYNTASSFSQTRVRSSGGPWTVLTAFFGGDVVVDNTLGAAKIVSNSITAAKIAANTITSSQIASNTITAGQIAAGAIGASQIAAGAITTDKLLVTGGGAALNDDPGFTDASAWSLYSGVLPVFGTVTDGAVGSRVARSSGAGVEAWINVATARRVPVDPNKAYRLRGWARTVSGSGSTLYIGLALFDAAGANITGDGSQWSYAAAGGVTVPAAWTKYQAAYGTGTGIAFPANARTMSPLAILSYDGGSAIHEVQDLRIEEMASADLIVDGAISAAKIAAGAVTTAKLDAGAVTADKVAANSISAAAIQSGAITTAKLAAGAVTANEIAASTITGDKIAANTITGSNIAADTITAGQIAAGAISASELAVGAVRTQHLVVAPKSLNPDPTFSAMGERWGGGFVRRLARSDPAVPANCPTPYATEFSARDNMWSYDDLEVVPGEVYRLSVWVSGGATGAGASAAMGGVGYVLNSAASVIDGFGWPGAAAPTSGWQRVTGIYTIPANGARLRIGVWANRGDPNGYTGESWYSDLTLEKVNDASLIVDGAITATKIAVNAIAVGTAAIQNGAIVNAMLGDATIETAKIKDAAITTAKIGDAQITNAKISGTIQSDNYVAGTSGWAITKSNGFAEFGAASIRGQLTASQINVSSLSALTSNIGTLTAGVVRNTADTFRVDVDNGRTIARTGTYMKVTGIPFGSASQFIEWFGPYFANLSSCTEANAVYYLKTNGSAYFGGTLSAGILTNRGATSDLGDGAEIIVGPFGTNGNTKTVTLSYSFGQQYTEYQGSSTGTGSGSISATVKLYRKIGAGSEAEVATLSVSGTWSYTTDGEPQPGPTYMRFWTQDMSGALTYTDSVSGTDNRTYRAKITARSLGFATSNGGAAQRVEVISVEQ